jgi:hypothetical protein
MVIDDFDVVGIPIRPNKAHSKPIVDADTVLSGAISLQSLQVVSGERKIPQTPRLIKLV